MRICTWNVDGLSKGGLDKVLPWLRRNQPDIVGLQEAGTGDPQSVISAFQSEGYRCELHVDCELCVDPENKSWKQGIAILSKQPLEVTQKCLPGQEHQGPRLLSARTAGLSITTLCVPSVWAKDQRVRERQFERKLEWLDSLGKHLRERGTGDGPAVLCGDFNITPKPIDNFYYWEKETRKENKKSPGNSKDERLWISSLLEAGWCDLVRHLHPNERMFSWWNTRDLYDRNKGRRIDLVFGDAAVVERLQCTRIDRGHYADRGRTGKPDHAPVIVDLA